MLKSFIPQVVKNFYHLCVAVLATIRYGYPAKHLTVIGVTGTDGKTTTANIIFQLLLRTGHQVALISTIGAFIGAERVDLGFHVTTPHSHKLQQLISRIKREGYQYLVLEATSHGLDQHRLFGTNIKYAVITNVTTDHLDYHKTFDRYLHAKARILRSVNIAILNQDDPSFPKLAALITPPTQKVTYSGNDLGAFDAKIKALWPESYNQANAIAAVTLVSNLGVDDSKIGEALAQPIPIPGRMEKVGTHHGVTCMVDFAHTPNALTLVLQNARTSCGGRLIAIFGAAGLRDYHKRPRMGEIAANSADFVILTAEDPRSEHVESIIYQIKQGIKKNHARVISLADRAEAVRFALDHIAMSGDTLLLLGKGHETSMNLDGVHEIPWSDRQLLLEKIATH